MPLGLFMLLSFSANSVYAEPSAYDLPYLGNNLTHFDEVNNKRADTDAALAQYLRQLTTKQISENTTMYLDPTAIKIESSYSSNIKTELKADKDGDVTFTFKFSF
ncbi:MAG: hypothetical protein ACRBB4_08390 [Neptuniibacter sp.]